MHTRGYISDSLYTEILFHFDGGHDGDVLIWTKDGDKITGELRIREEHLIAFVADYVRDRRTGILENMTYDNLLGLEE